MVSRVKEDLDASSLQLTLCPRRVFDCSMASSIQAVDVQELDAIDENGEPVLRRIEIDSAVVVQGHCFLHSQLSMS